MPLEPKKSVKANAGALFVLTFNFSTKLCVYESVKIRKDAQNIEFLFQQIDLSKTSAIIHNGKQITMPFHNLRGKRTAYIIMHKIKKTIKQRIC